MGGGGGGLRGWEDIERKYVTREDKKVVLCFTFSIQSLNGLNWALPKWSIPEL